MKFKPVPEPPADLEAVTTIHRAVPLDAGTVDDCCHELVAETPVSNRDDAATWLAFLRALEVAEETADGFRRLDVENGLDGDQLRQTFRERVYGTEATLAVLADADRPLPPAEVSARLADRDDGASVARGRNGDRNADVRLERVQRLLEWAVLFDLAERDGDRYRSR